MGREKNIRDLKKTSRDSSKITSRKYWFLPVGLATLQHSVHTKHEKYPLNQGSILCTGFANALKINLLRAEIPAPDTISDARFREALNVNTQFSEVSDISSMGHFVDLGQENTSVYAPSPETYLEKHRTPGA